MLIRVSFLLFIRKVIKLFINLLITHQIFIAFLVCVRAFSRAMSIDMNKTNEDLGLMEMMVDIYSFLSFQTGTVKRNP